MNFFWKSFLWLAVGVTVIISILSLGHFLEARGVFAHWLTIGPLYKQAIAEFRTQFLSRVLPVWLMPYLDLFASYVAHIIRDFLAPFNIHWSLRPDWKDIIVPLWLYFGRNALANRKANDEQIVTSAYNRLSDIQQQSQPPLPALIRRAKRGRRIFVWLLAAWGLLSALLIATATGLTPTQGSSLWSLGWFLVFFVAYELGSNALVVTLVPYVGETWFQSFQYRFQRTRQNIELGIAVSILAFVAAWLSPENTDGVLALLIFLYITLLALRDCLNAVRQVWREGEDGSGKWSKLQERAQFQLGLSVLVVVFGVILAVVTKI